MKSYVPYKLGGESSPYDGATMNNIKNHQNQGLSDKLQILHREEVSSSNEQSVYKYVFLHTPPPLYTPFKYENW